MDNAAPRPAIPVFPGGFQRGREILARARAASEERAAAAAAAGPAVPVAPVVRANEILTESAVEDAFALLPENPISRVFKRAQVSLAHVLANPGFYFTSRPAGTGLIENLVYIPNQLTYPAEPYNLQTNYENRLGEGVNLNIIQRLGKIYDDPSLRYEQRLNVFNLAGRLVTSREEPIVATEWVQRNRETTLAISETKDMSFYSVSYLRRRHLFAGVSLTQKSRRSRRKTRRQRQQQRRS